MKACGNHMYTHNYQHMTHFIVFLPPLALLSHQDDVAIGVGAGVGGFIFICGVLYFMCKGCKKKPSGGKGGGGGQPPVNYGNTASELNAVPMAQVVSVHSHPSNTV